MCIVVTHETEDGLPVAELLIAVPGGKKGGYLVDISKHVADQWGAHHGVIDLALVIKPGVSLQVRICNAPVALLALPEVSPRPEWDVEPGEVVASPTPDYSSSFEVPLGTWPADATGIESFAFARESGFFGREHEHETKPLQVISGSVDAVEMCPEMASSPAGGYMHL